MLVTTLVGLDNFFLAQARCSAACRADKRMFKKGQLLDLQHLLSFADENASIDYDIAEAVIKDGGVRLLLDLAKSSREDFDTAIANLSVYATVAKVVEEGGINILAGLARSMNRLVAEEGAKGLRNLSVGEQHKGAIVEAGGVKALVDLLFKWSTGGEEVLERAAAALANLAADAKCSTEVAVAGGVHALVMLARNCKFDGVQEQAARALTNLAAHGDSNFNNSATGQEAGALEAFVQLKRSPNKGVRQEAAGALWNLSFDDRNREAIAAAGGVEALERGFKAKEVVNSTSALSPSGPDPTHDNSNMSITNLANSTLYNSYGALNPSGADPYYDYINRSDTEGANSGNPLRQLRLIL